MPSPLRDLPDLTARLRAFAQQQQRDLISLMVTAGLSDADIALTLMISTRTVRRHRRALGLSRQRT